MNHVQDKIKYFESITFRQEFIPAKKVKTKTIKKVEAVRLGAILPKEDWPNIAKPIKDWVKDEIVILRCRNGLKFCYVRIIKPYDPASSLWFYFDGLNIHKADRKNLFRSKAHLIVLGQKVSKINWPNSNCLPIESCQEGDIVILSLPKPPFYKYIQLKKPADNIHFKFYFFDGKKIRVTDRNNFYETKFTPFLKAKSFKTSFFVFLGQNASRGNARKIRAGETFVKDEIIIVRRTNPLRYQYAQFVDYGIKATGIFKDDTEILSKSISHFFKTKRKAELLNDEEHNRSKIMLKLLSTSEKFNNGFLEVESNGSLKIYEPITGFTRSFCEHPIISCGSTVINREIILLDPQNSPLLEAHYINLKSSILLFNIKEEKLIAMSVLLYIRHTIFFYQDSLMAQNVKKIIKSFYTVNGLEDSIYAPIPLIPIDFFIDKGVGVCRHHSLISAYFLDRLKKDGFLQGNVSIIRQDIFSKSAHSWVLYRSESLKLHIDTFWDKFVNIEEDRDVWKLEKWYGLKPIEVEMKRFEEL